MTAKHYMTAKCVKVTALFGHLYELSITASVKKVKQSRYRPGVAQRVPGS
jgi:hypothetical protein